MKQNFDSAPSVRAIIGAVLVLSSFAFLVSLVAYQFSHPDMTSTHIFLNTWPVVLLAVLLLIIGVVVRTSANDAD